MYQNLIEQLPYGVSKLSSDYDFLYCNNKFLELFGSKRQVNFPETIFDIFTNDNKIKFKKIIHTLNTPTKSTTFQCKENGLYLEMNFLMVENNEIILSIKDITNEKKLEKKIQVDNENIKRLSDAVKGANIGVWDFFPQEGRILADETWVTQKKYKCKEFRESNSLFSPVIDGLNKWASLVHPDDLEPTSILIEKHLNGETDIYEAEFRMMCGDGKYRWIYDLGQVFQRDEKGTAIRMNGVHIDITNIKKLQNELNNKTKELELLASLDSLTKLYNRRYFSKTSEHIFNLAIRDKHDLSIIMIDIDDFKIINDTYGHEIGDKTLINIASILKRYSRKSDIICRYGGEEFLILLPSTSVNNAQKFAQMIHNKIKKSVFKIDDDKELKYTVSIGISQIDRINDLDVKEIINRADSALYDAKNKGKNITCMFNL